MMPRIGGRPRAEGRRNPQRRTIFAGNWPSALRPVPGQTKTKQLCYEAEVPEEPVEVSSPRTGQYTIRYVNRR